MKYLIPLIMLATACSTPCKGVIGAGYDTRTGIVDSIYPGTPAESLGIRVGDTLLYIQDWSGIAGEYVEVVFERWAIVHIRKVQLVCIDTLREWK